MEQNKIRITGIEETPFHTLTYQRLDEDGKLEQAENTPIVTTKKLDGQNNSITSMGVFASFS